MSDDFDDDDFLADDSFLREVDNIAAKIAPVAAAAPPSVPAGLSAAAIARRRAIALAVDAGLPTASGNGPAFHTNAVAGPSRPAARQLQTSLNFASSPRLTSSGIAAEDSASPDALSSATRHPGVANAGPSRFARTNSSSKLGSGGFQTHLNIWRENQTTRGKKWDRTMYAESGRKIGAKGRNAPKKGKGKAPQAGRGRRGYMDNEAEDGFDDDDDEEEEEDWGDPLVPGPKPFVDPNKEYEPQRHMISRSEAATYIYPSNKARRDYQYDIVRACFTDNCLVALPTGLGKTFIAGVVMLNFYRWFPTGKIVFLAPTKPLVIQQIEACQMSCGIPSMNAAVMTGESVSAKERTKLWADRRVFYCTPQTLDNDLKRGAVDPRDIVLAVFDEAHKASGSYAYTTILAYITAHHPYFRVLALTATPGADVPKVQGVVDALHISRIEIREAEAPEIRKYMNEKRTEKHFVPMGEVIEGFRDRWAALMKPFIQKLVERDILHERDLNTTRLKPYRLTAKRQEIGRDRNSGLSWAYGPLNQLEKMARAMGNLLEFSIGMFHTALTEMAAGVTASGKKSAPKGGSTSLRQNFEFQKLVRDVETEMSMVKKGLKGKTRADAHPKMAKTLELLLAHFAQAAEDERVHGIKNDTRAMVFCSFRNPVLEIVDVLNSQPGLLRATKFVGQAAGKTEGDVGFNQKEQKRTISEFKEGKYNILVSTSIGEEGLDIGEVDFVIIYDMPKQPIKLLQRIGRTGRKRDGQVHVLMSEGREDANWDTAQATHREIQEEILHSRNLELFDDVERLLPPGKLPDCVEQEMPVDPWDPSDLKKARKLFSPKRASKAKADKPVQRGHEIPEGGSIGFKSVAQLLKESGKSISKGKNTIKKTLSLEEALDAIDDESAAPARARAGTRGAKRKREPSPIASASSDAEADEQALEELFESRAKATASRKSAAAAKVAPAPKKSKPTDKSSLAKSKTAEHLRRNAQAEQAAAMERSALDFFAMSPPVRKRLLTPESSPPASSPPPAGRPSRQRSVSTSSELDSPPAKKRATKIARGRAPPSPITDESLGQAQQPPPLFTPDPAPSTRQYRAPPSPITDESMEQHVPPLFTPDAPPAQSKAKLTPRTAALAGFSQLDPVDLSWNGDDLEDDDASEAGAGIISSPVVALRAGRQTAPAASVARGRARTLGLSRARPIPRENEMPPPPVPLARTSSPPSSVRAAPSARPRDRQRREPAAERDAVSPLVGLGRSRRPGDARRAEPAAGRRRKRAPGHVQDMLDLDAEVSGTDSSDEASSSADIESESDRQFANDFQPTQAPKGYNQRSIYLQGQSTQAAAKLGLAFRPMGNKEAFFAKARRPVWISDDESEGGHGGAHGGAGASSENEYELGSFVCPDDDVDFASQSDPLSGR